MTTTASRRPAVTLVEVLMAIFVMGIGLMAVLSLFPLGAAQMAQALKDQRTAEAAANAAALGRVFWKQAVDDDLNTGANKFITLGNGPPSGPYPRTAYYPFANQQFVMALDDPSYAPPGQPVPDYNNNAGLQPDPYLPSGASGNQPAMPIIPRTGAGSTGASYPVFVDPFGWQSAQTVSRKFWLPAVPVQVGNTALLWRIPRRTLYVRDTSLPASASAPWIPLGSVGAARDSSNNPTPAALALGGIGRVLKQFSLMDDLSFNDNGTPNLDGNPKTDDTALATSKSPPPIDRQGRYTWSYLFRRRNNADRTNVDITTVVYSGRSIDVPSPETAFLGTAQFPTVNVGETPTTKRLTLIYSGAKPAIRRGTWVLDATLSDAYGALDPQGIFYRVVNVDDSTAGTLDLEIQTPIVGKTRPPDQNNVPFLQTTQRVIIVMENVVEVFTRTGVSAVSPPLPY